MRPMPQNTIASKDFPDQKRRHDQINDTASKQREQKRPSNRRGIRKEVESKPSSGVVGNASLNTAKDGNLTAGPQGCASLIVCASFDTHRCWCIITAILVQALDDWRRLFDPQRKDAQREARLLFRLAMAYGAEDGVSALVMVGAVNVSSSWAREKGL